MGRWYEVVVFTASMQHYADKVILIFFFIYLKPRVE